MTEPEFDLFFPDLQRRAIEYNARASVADFDACVRDYAERSALAKASCAGIYDLKYGLASAERLDLFPVPLPGQPAPLFIFIHGGYWRAQTKEDAALMAKVFTDAGVAVATLEYSLLPRVTLAEIVREMREAVAWLYHNAAQFGIDPARLHVGGSSAGAHLVGMLLADGWKQEFGLPEDVLKGAAALSGLYDLRPLCDIEPNDWIRLMPAQAERLSPLFLIPEKAPPLILSVGGLETDGFKRQTQAYEAAWRKRGLDVTLVNAADRNHFDLLLELAYPDRPLTAAILQMITGEPHVRAVNMAAE